MNLDIKPVIQNKKRRHRNRTCVAGISVKDNLNSTEKEIELAKPYPDFV